MVWPVASMPTPANKKCFFIMGCEDNHAEEAGERIDEAVTDVQNKVEDACEEVKEGVNAEETNC